MQDQSITCDLKKCASAPIVPHGTTACSTSGALIVGTSCSVSCLPGFLLQGSRTVECVVRGSPQDSSTAGIALEFTNAGVCLPRYCDPVQHVSPLISAVDNNRSRALIGDVRFVTCVDGYHWPTSLKQPIPLSCVPKSAAVEAEVGWNASGTCIPFVTCPVPTLPSSPGASGLKCSGGRRWREGDECQLLCSDGYISAAGSLVCNKSHGWEGAVQCLPMSCDLPSQSVDKMVSRNCVDPLLHNDTCTIKCEKGFNAAGEYMCAFGVIVQVPACLVDGALVEVLHAVVGKMDLIVMLPNSSLNLRGDAQVGQTLSVAISEGLGGVDPLNIKIWTLGVNASSNNVLDKVNHPAARLLASTRAHMRFQYEIRASSTNVATTYATRISTSSFTNSLQPGLETRIHGLQVLGVNLQVPHVVVRHSSAAEQLDTQLREQYGLPLTRMVVISSIATVVPLLAMLACWVRHGRHRRKKAYVSEDCRHFDNERHGSSFEKELPVDPMRSSALEPVLECALTTDCEPSSIQPACKGSDTCQL